MYSFLDLKTENEVPVEPWKDNVRLPTNIKPVLYDIMMKPMFDLSRFYGRETLTVEVTQPTTFFAVHVKNITVTSASVSCASKEMPQPVVKRSFLYEPNEFWIIDMENQVKPGLYNLNFEFEGSLRNNFDSMFRGQFFSEDMNCHRNIVATRFKPIGARQAYPCFDEPDMKAKFKFRIVRPLEKYTVITNEMIEKEEFGPDKNEVTVFFKETKPIPTFLSGFVISDLRDSTNLSIDNMSAKLQVKIHAAPEKVDKFVFAREIAASVAKYFIDYFNLPFPVDKLDLVALPDFPLPSMEQLGFITFNEINLLYEDRVTSIEDRKEIALIVAREICRQWFGCLVTMKWWNEFWLSEGFVNLMQYKALDEGVKMCRDWKLSEQLMFDVIHPVLDADSVALSHPLQVDTDDPQEASEVFDDLACNKGLAVLRMLESFVGKDNFRKGIHRFLKSYTESGASCEDLWQCLNTEVNDPDVNVGEIIDTWSKQSGYPVIYAIRRANTWVLSQNRFLTDRDAFVNTNDSPYRYKWDVPVHYITSNDKKPVLVWFRKTEECVKITMSDRTVTFIKFNHAQTGLYRVNYEGCLWRQFANILEQDPTRLNCLDRVNLIDDVFHLAEAGQTDYHYAFELLKYMEKELDYLPWATAASNLYKLMSRVPHTHCYGLLMKLVRCLIRRLYGSAEGQFSWNSGSSDSQIKRLLRVVILDLACFSKLPECVADLRQKFREWIVTGEMPVEADLAKVLLRYGMREVGTLEDWDVVWARYDKETNSQMKRILLESLANLKEPWAIVALLEDARNELRDCDYIPFLRFLSENPYTLNLHWNFIRDGWEYISGRFASRLGEFTDFVQETASKFSMPSQLDEVQVFFEKHPDSCADEDARKLVFESIKRNIRFCKRYRDIITNWLMENINE